MKEHDSLRELSIIWYRWSTVRREMEDGSAEMVGRGQIVESLQTTVFP